MLFTGLHGLSLFSHTTQDLLPRGGITHSVGPGPSTLIKTMSYRLAYWPIWWRPFSQWRFPLPSCQVDPKTLTSIPCDRKILTSFPLRSSLSLFFHFYQLSSYLLVMAWILGMLWSFGCQPVALLSDGEICRRWDLLLICRSSVPVVSSGMDGTLEPQPHALTATEAQVWSPPCSLVLPKGCGASRTWTETFAIGNQSKSSF